MIKVAVIGLGYFSQFHLTSWIDMAETQVIAITDLDPARRNWATENFGVPVVDSVDAALIHNPQVVDIVAPPRAHAALIRATLAPGRVIICQKPFCISLEEARAVTHEVEAAGARLVIHENFRFQPWHRTIKSVLDSGRIGQVYSARFALRPGDGRGPNAYLDRQPAFQTMPRLLVHETGVHFIDLFCWLFGDATDVYADLRQLNPALQGEDAGTLILTHKSGAQSHFEGNRLADHATDAPRRTMGEMEIIGEGGTLTLNGYGQIHFRPFGAETANLIPLIAQPDDSFGGGCVAALNAHVVAVLTGTGTLENEAKDYLQVIALSDLAYQSDTEGRKLPFNP
ncbi:MAG: Gfo/Idh/MocA family oxidoreductase [Pseudomonadota bacterium]